MSVFASTVIMKSHAYHVGGIGILIISKPAIVMLFGVLWKYFMCSFGLLGRMDISVTHEDSLVVSDSNSLTVWYSREFFLSFFFKNS